MKVSIGTKIKDGPWGGGNLFAINLSNFLQSNGHQVVFDLNDNDIDLILITEPRKTSESSAFTHIDVQKYKKFVNSKVIVVHRINECDERKNTNYVNKYLIYANRIADQTVYVSKWIMDLYLSQGIKSTYNKVIYAGADEEIFFPPSTSRKKENKKLKICTHHWGDNWNKGFDAYLLLDDLLNNQFWKEKIEFTYIGKVNKNANFKNTKIIEPIAGETLANELRNNDLYITGSINEPSGNHHIEAAQCGLPIMYIDSGGVSEYCKGFGLEYNLDNFEQKLKEIINNLYNYQTNMSNYPHTSTKMCIEYLELFNSLVLNNTLGSNKNLNSRFSIERIIYKFTRNLRKNFSQF